MLLKGFFGQKKILLALLVLFFAKFSFASEAPAHGSETKFNVKETTFHHLLDNYDWEFYTKADGTPVKISLPRILWNPKTSNLDVFGSTEAALAAGYLDAHHYDHSAKHGDLLVPQAKETLEHGDAPHADAHEAAAVDVSEYKPWDFSITKNVLFMFIASFILILVFTAVARGYKKNEGKAPKGIQSFFEPIVVFVRDDIAKPNITHNYERFMPLLLTLFFFIWFLNMLGMMPFSGNVSGNISVTLALSLVTLIAVNFSANKAYWKHILWPPVPHAIKLIMVPLEILSIFTKPFALTIRLFANITGGHVIMVSLLGLIFIFGKMGQNVTAGWGVGFFSTMFIVAISLLELFVAVLQAFVFTMLTAVFIGQATAEEEHH